MTHQFTTCIQVLESNVWGNHIVVPTEVALYYLEEKKSKRVLCTMSNGFSFQCAIMKSKDLYFINLSKEIRKKSGELEEGDEVELTIALDESKYGLPVPEEFEEMLYQDPVGNELFHKLTPGRQRSLLYIIGKPKSSAIRMKKGWVVLDYLKDTAGKLDFKELNHYFKEANK